MKKIAFFDFDGTITTRDTLFEVIKHHKGKMKFYTGLLLNAPYLIGFKIKLITNQYAKEKILEYFFKGMEFSKFQKICDDFATCALPSVVRPGAAAEIQKLKSSGFEVVIVSASAENWIKAWADEIGVQLIGSQLEIVDDRVTGKLKGNNCNGGEKVNRIRLAYDVSQYDEIYAFGDTKGDKPMLALAGKSFYKPFRG
ncbi:HAD family hydrolase [Mucilaginibacter sp.]|uniref:HAD family hydrolase n=1 Tax=Mucilaginibacter sp. TaxID=1882438 RepID=UPI002843C0F0|nr:HAD family hydrolase [Mucilaginibacter sp.]MDR3697930.1 HAD family hydrolase [Mucilaginibacter sp.]